MLMSTSRIQLIGVAVIALVIGFFVGTFVLTVPAPRILSVERNDLGIAIEGTAAKGVAVLVFGFDGELLSITRADADGAFAFEAIAPANGTKHVFLRSLDRGWRASPPKTISLEDIPAQEASSSENETATSTDELPPLGIPPTSTRPKEEDVATSTESEPERDVLSVSAAASVANTSLKSKANQTVTITVKDDEDQPLSGATVTVVAHYPTEDVTYTATGSNGTYRARFRVPDNIGAGTNVIVDVTASYREFTSTARTVFAVR